MFIYLVDQCICLVKLTTNQCNDNSWQNGNTNDRWKKKNNGYDEVFINSRTAVITGPA